MALTFLGTLYRFYHFKFWVYGSQTTVILSPTIRPRPATGICTVNDGQHCVKVTRWCQTQGWK